jgi:hypothetical protein
MVPCGVSLSWPGLIRPGFFFLAPAVDEHTNTRARCVSVGVSTKWCDTRVAQSKVRGGHAIKADDWQQWSQWWW